MSIDEQPPSRRGVLKAFGIGGALLTAGVAAKPLTGLTSASAAPGQEPQGTLDTPSLQILLMGVEYVGSSLYQAAVDGGSLDADTAEIAQRFAANHQAHGDTFAELVGVEANEQKPLAPLLEQLSPTVQGKDQDAVLKALLDFEDKAAATYQTVLGLVDDPSDARGIADPLLVNVQQAVTLATLTDAELASYVPDEEPTEGALDPDTYADDLTSVSTTTAAAG